MINKSINKYTLSVISYLESYPEIVWGYFDECRSKGKLPSYLELSNKYLNGTTSEDVPFNYYEIDMFMLTEYLVNNYNVWLLSFN